MKKFSIVWMLLLTSLFVFAACVPSEFTQGVDIDEAYPEDILALYDDVIVFESTARFDKVKLSCGTQDDLDDIIEYYQDFYEYKKIQPIQEQADKDEYYALFAVDGFEFEIDVAEAKGDHVEKLFQYVIELSTKQLDSSEVVQNDSNDHDTDDVDTNTTQTEGAEQRDETSLVGNTEDVVQKHVLANETAMIQPMQGAWYAYMMKKADGSDLYVDCTLYFADDSTGSYHYFNYQTGQKDDLNFHYAVVNGVLVLQLSNDERILYDAYYDNGEMHLIHQETDESMMMRSWEKESQKTANINEFTAYGDWFTYSPDDGRVITMGIWENRKGYVYNWMNDDSNDRMTWTHTGMSLTFDVGTLYREELELHHRGNVLQATTSDGTIYYFYRITTNVMAGVYEVTYTNDNDVSKWVATLNYDQSSSHRISANRIAFNYDNSSWYINPVDGRFYVFIFGEYAYFDYHFDQRDLILYEPTEALDYTFEKTQ